VLACKSVHTCCSSNINMATCCCTCMSWIIGVEDAHAMEEHVCVNDDCCFPKLGASQWKHHRDDWCLHCSQKRFKLVWPAPDAKSDWCPGRRFGICGLCGQLENSCLAMPHGVAIEALLVSRTSMTTRYHKTFWYFCY